MTALDQITGALDPVSARGIARRVADLINTGAIPPGERMPTTRAPEGPHHKSGSVVPTVAITHPGVAGPAAHGAERLVLVAEPRTGCGRQAIYRASRGPNAAQVASHGCASFTEMCTSSRSSTTVVLSLIFRGVSA